ncbi:MAG: type II toxin-antitoxin system VapC family toxin [Sedimentisphaerales bacterium]|nr:type II toxin-antitoxin system VapC family toxin [Sedimentisphaerales bacterium]
MNLVDSSGWLEYFADGPNAEFFATAIEDIENLIVSTINIYEVYKRILQQRGEDAALQGVALMHQAGVVDVTSPIAMDAVKLSAEFKLPMADSLILATARTYGATLWTQDADFQGLPDVKFTKK